MPDIAKALKGLDLCRYDPDPGMPTKSMVSCDICPYWDDQFGCREIELLNDAIALLKAQKPRLMSLEEVKAAEGRDVWLEQSGNIADDILTATTIYGCGSGGICTWYESLSYSLYNKRPYGWRCWTARPTDEQREMEPWCG